MKLNIDLMKNRVFKETSTFVAELTLENVGGELNAYTSKEETIVYAGILKEYSERAIELLADIVLNSVFPQKEIDKEVDIILDEIQSYNDSPSELIYDDFEEILFDGNALAHNILGTEDILKNFTTQHAQSFVSRRNTSKRVLVEFWRWL
jgi:predicted Zn-dependent peptidase